MRDETRHVVGNESAGRKPIWCAVCRGRPAEFTDDIRKDPMCLECYESAPGVIGTYTRQASRAVGHWIADQYEK